MGHNLEETTAMRNLVGVLMSNIVHASNELAPIARICKANLVGHPKGSQRRRGTSQEENGNRSVERTGRDRNDPRANLAGKGLLRKVEKGVRRAEEVDATVRRTAGFEVLAHVGAQVFIGNPKVQSAHWGNRTACV